MRELIVPVRGDGKGELLLTNAITLAKRFNAHIDVVHCRPKPADLLAYGMAIPTGLRTQIEQSASQVGDADEAFLRQLFDRYADERGLEICDARPWPVDRTTARWREEIGTQPSIIERVGHLVDLIVLARPERKSGLGYRTLEAALLHSGRPTMLSPPNEISSSVGDHILIGWHGGTETARTIAMSMPIITRAKRITLVEVETEGGSKPTVEAAADYLREYRLDVAVEMKRSAANRVAQTLMSTAGEVGADSMMIGAYGTSRRLEFVFGGVTQHIIEHAELPVFMTH